MRDAESGWADVPGQLDERGYAVVPGVLDAGACRMLAAIYADDAPFRKRIVMQQHAYGRGEYKYLAYPLPDAIGALRKQAYARLAPIANAWRERLGQEARFPPDLDAYLAQCHAAGQTRPTPLILRYEAGDFNCLHQDLYGQYVFPFQMTVLLSEAGRDFEGGEFLLVEQRPRAQSRGEVVALRQGEAVIFPVRERPMQGTRGTYRVNLRHGVSRVRSGLRFTLGVIFHDAA